MAEFDRYIERTLGTLKVGDVFMYLGSKEATHYVVESNNGSEIKYFISESGKFDLKRNYTIDLNKPYASYGYRYNRRVLKQIY